MPAGSVTERKKKNSSLVSSDANAFVSVKSRYLKRYKTEKGNTIEAKVIQADFRQWDNKANVNPQKIDTTIKPRGTRPEAL